MKDPADASPPPTVWVTVAEAAEKSGIGTSTIRQWYRSGRIPTQRAGGDKGAFLVPLDAVTALADRADEEGDDLGAAVIDLNASYWSAQTEAAREETAEVRRELAAVRVDLADAEADLDQFEADLATARAERDAAVQELEALRNDRTPVTAPAPTAVEESPSAAQVALEAEGKRLAAENAELREELEAVRADLASAEEELSTARAEQRATAEELDTFRNRIALLQEELTELRAVTAKAGSITDNSWLEQPTNSYRSPVRPQGMAAAEALSGLLASTQPDLGVPAARLDGTTGTTDETRADATPTATSPATKRSKPAKTMFDDVDQRKAAVRRPPVVQFPEATAPAADPATADADGAAETPRVDDEAWAEERRAAARDFGFGQHDDDLLPEPEKKPRRGRK